jgi:hypothetical protein
VNKRQRRKAWKRIANGCAPARYNSLLEGGVQYLRFTRPGQQLITFDTETTPPWPSDITILWNASRHFKID